jgi:hypothetical protein
MESHALASDLTFSGRHPQPCTSGRLGLSLRWLRRALLSLTRSDLGGLDGAHLGDPSRSRLHLANGAEIVRRIAGNADVVCALENELDVANLQDLGSTLLGVAAGRSKDVVNKAVSESEDVL